MPQSRASVLRPALLVVLGLAVLGAAVGLALHTRDASQAVPSPAAVPPQPGAANSAAALPKPSFDVVRVNPQGDAVIAGTAAPGTDVAIMDAGKVIGHAQADQHGDWVFVPSSPLPSGARQLTLTERAADGQVQTSDGSVLLVVPGGAGTEAPPLAVVTAQNAAPRVLVGPGPANSNKLALGAVGYDEHGEIRLSGQAPPGATVRVYADDHPIGETKAGVDGHWTLSPKEAIAAGTHRLRLDQTGAGGDVVARVELPFQREQVSAVAEGSVVVQPGNSLWRLAHRAYGSGTRYTVIYDANRSEIRNPDMIYPGQVFSVPVAADTHAGTAMPVSSNRSK